MVEQRTMKIVNGVDFAGQVDSVENSEVLARMAPDQRNHGEFPAQFPVEEEKYNPLKADREVREELERIYEKVT